eukprot:scaffold22805_cov59-Phaeocystis_antarctica.AAC.7
MTGGSRDHIRRVLPLVARPHLVLSGHLFGSHRCGGHDVCGVGRRRAARRQLQLLDEGALLDLVGPPLLLRPLLQAIEGAELEPGALEPGRERHEVAALTRTARMDATRCVGGVQAQLALVVPANGGAGARAVARAVGGFTEA